MASKPAVDQRPMCTTAVLGLFLAFVSVGLSLFGTFAPYLALTFPLQKFTGAKSFLIYGGLFILPFILGLLAVLMGSHALKVVEQSECRLRGAGPSVFAVMLGMFGLITAGVAIFATLIYPNLPSL